MGTRAFRKAAAVAVSFCLPAASPGISGYAVLAAEPSPRLDPAAVVRFLEDNGVLKKGDPSDPLRGYVVKDGGAVTPVGEALYKYFRARPKAVKDVAPALDQLRETGAYSEAKAKSVDKALRDFESQYGSISSARPEDGFALGGRLNAILTGAAARESSQQDFVQVETDSGFDLFDERGLAYRYNKNQVLLYRRDYADMQKAMGLPQTGRFSYAMLEYQYNGLKKQYAELEKARHVDRMVKLAELLGKSQQIKQDQYTEQEARLEEDLAAEAKKKTLGETDGICGRKVSDYLDLVDCRLEKRVEHLKNAADSLAFYGRRMEEFKNADAVAEVSIQAMETNKQQVSKYLTLAWLDTQRFHVLDQVERLTPDSPDSLQLTKAVRDSPFDGDLKSRYLTQGYALASRLKQLLAVFRRVQDKLEGAAFASNMASSQAALQQSEKELNEISLDYMIYAAMPALSALSKDEGEDVAEHTVPWLGYKFKMESVAGITRWGAGILKRRLGLAGGYLQDRKDSDRYLANFPEVARLVSEGDWAAARALLIDTDPLAVNTHGGLPKGTEAPADVVKAHAVLAKAQEVLGRSAGVHLYVGIGANLFLWSAATAVAAPLASAALSGVSKAALTAANVTSKVARWGGVFRYTVGLGLRPLAFGFRVAGYLAEQGQLRLQTLGPAADKVRGSNWALRYMDALAVRNVNMTMRLGVFTGLSGGISGGYMGVKYYWDKAAGGHSPYASVGEAVSQGVPGGMKWAVDSWHPVMLWVGGVPSNAFEGTYGISQVTKIAGEEGVVGMGTKLLTWGKVGLNDGLQWMTKHYMAIPATVIGMADNVAKYSLFSELMVASPVKAWSMSHNYVDGSNIERRIKRAEQAGMLMSQDGVGLGFMSLPLWLLLPVFPAKYEEAAAGFQRSQQGMKEYDAAGELHLIAEAAEGSKLALKNAPAVPMMQKIFNFRMRGESFEHGDFAVSKQMKLDAIRKVLPGELRGSGAGGKNVDPMSVPPLDYFKVANDYEEGDMVGRLAWTDEVGTQAQKLFEESLLKNSALARKVLDPENLGKEVEGFGRVKLKHQEEVARVLYRAAMEKGLAKLFLPKVKAADLAAAKKILEPYWKTEEMVSAKAKELLSALRENPNPGKDYERWFQDALGRVEEWVQNQKDKGHAEYQKPYAELIAEFREKAASYGGEGKDVPAKMVEYLEAIERRFQVNNKAGPAAERALRALGELKSEQAGSAEVPKTIERMMKAVERWKAGESDPEAPTGKSFDEMLAALRKDVQAKESLLSKRDYRMLQDALREIESAPWLLHNVKGSALPGWKPEQFQALMEFMGSLATRGAHAGKFIRTFLMLKTGGGKTLLAYEGILPLAEIDADAGGKTLVYSTSQSNLDAQAQRDFAAQRKLNSKLKFMTYEELKTEVAQNKLTGSSGAAKYYIIGDEMDAAALQPALTIGETTASVSKEHGAYRAFKTIADRLESLFGRGKQDVAKKLEFHVRRQQNVADEIKEANPQLAEALRRTTETLLAASEELAKARAPQEYAAAEKKAQAALKAQETALVAPPGLTAETKARLDKASVELSSLGRRLSEGESREAVAEAAKRADALLAEQLSALDSSAAGKLRSAAKGLLIAASKLAEAKTPEEFAKAQVRLRGALAKQERLLGASSGLEARGRLAEIARELGSLAEKDPVEAGSGGLSALRLRKLAREQKAALDSLAPASDVSRDAMQAKALKPLLESLRAGLRDLLPEAFPGAKAAREAPNAAGGEKAGLEGLRGRAGKASARLEKLAVDARDILKSGTGTDADAVARFRKAAGGIREVLKTGEPELTAKQKKALIKETGRNFESQINVLRRAEFLGAEAKARKLAQAGQARAEGRAAEAGRLQAQAEAIGSKSGVTSWIKENERRILNAIEEGEPGWEGAVRDLLAERREFVDSAVDKKNPFYETFARMREDMYSLYASTFRKQVDAEVLAEAPARVRDAVSGRSRAFVKSLEAYIEALRKAGDSGPAAGEALASAQKLLASARKQNAAWEARAQKAAEAFEKASTPEQKALKLAYQSGREKLSEADRLVLELWNKVEAAEAPAKPALLQQLEAAKKEADARNTTVRDLQRGLGKLEESQRLALKAEIEKLREESAKPEEWAAELGGYDPKTGTFSLDAELERLRGASGEVWKSLNDRARQAEAAGDREKAVELKGLADSLEGGRAELEGMRRNLLPGQAAWDGQLARLDMSADKAVEALHRKVDVLAKRYARELMWNLLKDPFMPPAQKWKLFWSLLPSSMFPRTFLGDGWVRTELLRLARGYNDNPANIRMDNITGKINVIHNGQWFESMDNDTRRFWELEYGADLTLPYEHRTIVTINDFMRDNLKVNMIGLSGTAGDGFRNTLDESNFKVAGRPSLGAADIKLRLEPGPSGKFEAVSRAVKATEEPGGLVVLSLSDTRMLKLVERFLIKTGKLDAGQIAKVFSDTERLRLNNPDAQVARQMNLEGLNTGKVKMLLLDTRVGGRGLDLNFKGERTSQSPDAFKGYDHMEMLIIDPQEMTKVHCIQAQGRIDLGRVNPGTVRNFQLVMDVDTAKKDPEFERMFNEEPVMRSLSEEPAVLESALARGRLTPDWSDVHAYVLGLEEKNAADPRPALYRERIKKYLDSKQEKVEEDLLRSSQVLKDRPIRSRGMNGLESWR